MHISKMGWYKTNFINQILFLKLQSYSKYITNTNHISNLILIPKSISTIQYKYNTSYNHIQIYNKYSHINNLILIPKSFGTIQYKYKYISIQIKLTKFNTKTNSTQI